MIFKEDLKINFFHTPYDIRAISFDILSNYAPPPMVAGECNYSDVSLEDDLMISRERGDGQNY
jgi:hypothetical protein